MSRKFQSPPSNVRALQALTKLGRDAAQRPTTAELDQGLTDLLARMAEQRARRVKVVRSFVFALVAAVCLFVCIQSASFLRERFAGLPKLAYRIEGGSVLEGGYLHDAGNGGIRLFFNEGTKVTLAPGARGRLRSVDKDGTRVVLDQGTASFDVARSKERKWLVEAGPFSVAVKGTFFTVSWAPVTERFELMLRHGSVLVSGPTASGDIMLHAGQRLVVNLPRAETLITDGQADEAANTSPSGSADPAAIVSAPSAPQSETASLPAANSAAPGTPGPINKVERKVPWSEQMAKGHWDRILDEVDQADLGETLEHASSEDLFVLADAARYRRRPDLARAALLAQRRRFPSSSRSRDAAFLLGRVEESRDRAAAIAWYDAYLAGGATGAYAAEAWGRKMVLTNELKGRTLAQPLAEEYLRRFPQGSYARSARALCAEP